MTALSSVGPGPGSGHGPRWIEMIRLVIDAYWKPPLELENPEGLEDAVARNVAGMCFSGGGLSCAVSCRVELTLTLLMLIVPKSP